MDFITIKLTTVWETSFFEFFFSKHLKIQVANLSYEGLSSTPPLLPPEFGHGWLGPFHDKQIARVEVVAIYVRP